MQATCGGNCCGAGWLYCLFYHFGLAVVPQCITRGEVRRINGLQVCHQHFTGARLCALVWNMACGLSPRTYVCILRQPWFAVQPAPCADCLTSWCCQPCGLCQEAREIKIRGGKLLLATLHAILDPSSHDNSFSQAREPCLKSKYTLDYYVADHCICIAVYFRLLRSRSLHMHIVTDYNSCSNVHVL